MSSVQILDRLGSAAFTIAVVALLLLFVPRLVRAEAVSADAGWTAEAGWLDRITLAVCTEPNAVSVSGSALSW